MRTATAEPVGRGRVLATVVTVMVLCCVPVFLTGSLSSLLAPELGLTTAGTGTAIALYFVAAAICSIPAGRFADHAGASVALRLAVVLGTAAAVAIGAVASTGWHLFALAVVGGGALALADTGCARALATALPSDRQGTAFGIKESSVPAASLLAGIAVPVLGTQVGWRPAYVGALGLGVVALLLVGTRPLGTGTRSQRPPDAHAAHARDGHAAHAPNGRIANAPDGHAAHAPDGHAAHAPDGGDADAPDGHAVHAPDGGDADAPDGHAAHAPDGHAAHAPDRHTAHAPDAGGARASDGGVAAPYGPHDIGGEDAAVAVVASRSTEPAGSARPAPSLAVLALAAGLAGAVVAAVSTFLVPSLQASGVPLGVAGVVLSVASGAAVVTRLVVGRLADRVAGSELTSIRALIGLGALGLALLALTSTATMGTGPGGTAVLVVAALVSLGAGWGWTGVVFLAAIRTAPERPAAAAAAVLAGLGFGGAAGPAVVGWIAQTATFRTAWTLGAATMVIALVALVAGSRRPATRTPPAPASAT